MAVLLLVGGHPSGALAPAAGSGAASNERPLALIYRNPPLADKDDAADAAAMLQASPYQFRIQYVGPNDLTAELLNQAALFVEPGGEVETETAKEDFAHEIPLVNQYVAEGGRYLGICAGGFVAGEEGYDVFPGRVGSYVDSAGAEAESDKDQAIQIIWRDGSKRTVDFQDGNYFAIPPGTPGVTVMATYTNGLPAAAVAAHGKGKSAFIGPHFESAPDDDSDDHTNFGLDFELLDVLMR
ncbi:hypothetical protein GCM10023321_32160 [Pseudonocardia eucalypti]|uniref:Biotin-protein ligase N-terminal domain-containing protein n=1 Tax=Pseudonocardia eucalypti TaxID=648755 RepID=A0ABP9Q5F3_9PSEU